MAAPPQKAVSSLLLIAIFAGIIENRYIFVAVEGAYWCVARSDASTQALQTALDYACGTGADCGPILSNGLCYLPNTIQAHASYAFNSYFQRKGMEPGSCDFSGTATVAQTDPSTYSLLFRSSVIFLLNIRFTGCLMLLLSRFCAFGCRLWILCVSIFRKVCAIFYLFSEHIFSC